MGGVFYDHVKELDPIEGIWSVNCTAHIEFPNGKSDTHFTENRCHYVIFKFGDKFIRRSFEKGDYDKKNCFTEYFQSQEKKDEYLWRRLGKDVDLNTIALLKSGNKLEYRSAENVKLPGAYIFFELTKISPKVLGH